MAARERLVVIGNGMAGARAVEEIVARGGAARFDITVFGEEPHGNYNRIMLSGVLSGAASPEDILLNPVEWYAANDVALRAGMRIASIDRDAGAVVTGAGETVPYDRLLIATGSRALLPPMQGTHDAAGTLRPGVHAFRSLADCHAIIAGARAARHVAVIGGGLLGLEAARGLLTHGCAVTVVHLGPHLMNTQLDAEGGAMLAGAMARLGVAIALDRETVAILGKDDGADGTGGRVTGLAFRDGTTLDCDMVVIAAGIRPNVELARAAGLAVERAIVVDDAMRAVDDPRIFVVGECAQHRGRVYGLVAPLWEQARVVADRLTGRDPDARYGGSRLATKLKVMGVELASMGAVEPADAADEVIRFSDPRRGIYKKLIVRDGRLAGAILIGDVGKAAFLMQSFDREAELPEERLALLFDVGGGEASVPVETLPADAPICHCNGVSKGAIGVAIAAGARDVPAVMQATRAGTGCGTCRPVLTTLIALAPPEAAPETPSAAVSAAIASYTPEALMRIAADAARDGVERLLLTPAGLVASVRADAELVLPG